MNCVVAVMLLASVIVAVIATISQLFFDFGLAHAG
jgi:hypothetical protein